MSYTPYQPPDKPPGSPLHRTDYPSYQTTQAPIVRGLICADCGQNIEFTWSFSKDFQGLDPIAVQRTSFFSRNAEIYRIRCSMYGHLLCVVCADRKKLSSSSEIVRHFANLFRLTPVTNHNLAASPFYVICRACAARSGLASKGLAAVIADTYQRAGRHEDLAQLHEALGNWDEAGRARTQGKQRTVKNINVDLNALLDKLSRGGLTAAYRCPSCGASITVNSSSKSEALKFCSYCGSAVDTDSLLKILQRTLS